MIPFLDLKAQYASIQDDLESAVIDVMRSGQYALGPAVERFEQDFADYCGVEFAIGVNSGTSALHLALLAEDIGPGDEVITVSMSFVATTAAILYTGATPVFVEIDPDNWTMAPKALEAAITPQTKAIIPVHLHGRLADMEAIMAIADRYGIAVIEDAAQAHGATRAGKRAGAYGTSAAFSFYPGKNLGACGEAGAVITNDPERAQRIRMLRDWGQTEKYHHAENGFNYRMDGIQAAVLGVKLRHIDRWSEARIGRANHYRHLLRASLNDSDIQIPGAASDKEHVYHVFAVRVANRNAIQSALESRNIATNMHYPIPIHLQPAYSSLGYSRGALPETESFGEEILSLPLFPELTDQQVADVVAALIDLLRG